MAMVLPLDGATGGDRRCRHEVIVPETGGVSMHRPAALVSIDGTGGLVRLLIVVACCTALAAGLRRRAGLGSGRDELVAAARATLQLALVGVVITAVLRSWWLTLAFVTLMLVVATLTAARRVTGSWSPWPALPVALGALPVTAALVASGVVPAQPVSVVPVAGILVGNAMTATSLSGRRSLDALTARRGELEAALSLGLLPRPAAIFVSRDDVKLALVPGLDQTRTVGLVTLPGAFVGVLLGGGSPLQAAAVQLLVLVALLLVQSVAVAMTLELVARGRLVRAAH